MKTLALHSLAKFLPYMLGTAGKARLSTLIYHRVLAAPDPLRPGEPTASEFAWQMRLIKRYFNPLPLTEAVHRLQDGTLPERAVCVTFDDGYADNAALALPILRDYAVPATVFVSTGYLNGGRMWNDRVIETIRNVAGHTLDLHDIGLGSFSLVTDQDRQAAVAEILRGIKHRQPDERIELVTRIEQHCSVPMQELMMTDQQVRELSVGGIEVGAHTVQHPILARVSDEAAYAEIGESKAYLENLLQTEITSFAYPNGTPDTDYTKAHRDMLPRLGFRQAVSTHWGVANAQSDPYQLPRFTPWDKRDAQFVLRMLLNYRRLDPLLA